MDRDALKVVLSNCDAKRDHNYGLGADNFTITTKEYAMLRDLALQSLSQEAVRDEALEEAARVCENFPTVVVPFMRGEIAKHIRALKREPDAECQHERAKRLRLSDHSSGEHRALPPGGRAECWCCGEFVQEIVLFRSFNICKACWNESEPNAAAEKCPDCGAIVTDHAKLFCVRIPCPLNRTTEPAPTAPDVASVVKRIRECLHEHNRIRIAFMHNLERDVKPLEYETERQALEALDQAATLLAKLGGGFRRRQSSKSMRMARFIMKV